MYLQGYIMYTDQLRWSDSPWDAWKTRIRAEARSVQMKTGGTIMLWNTIVGKMREVVMD
jgi:hypothetical protein